LSRSKWMMGCKENWSLMWLSYRFSLILWLSLDLLSLIFIFGFFCYSMKNLWKSIVWMIFSIKIFLKLRILQKKRFLSLNHLHVSNLPWIISKPLEIIPQINLATRSTHKWVMFNFSFLPITLFGSPTVHWSLLFFKLTIQFFIIFSFI
jgi:hypothetical protein